MNYIIAFYTDILSRIFAFLTVLYLRFHCFGQHFIYQLFINYYILYLG